MTAATRTDGLSYPALKSFLKPVSELTWKSWIWGGLNETTTELLGAILAGDTPRTSSELARRLRKDGHELYHGHGEGHCACCYIPIAADELHTTIEDPEDGCFGGAVCLGCAAINAGLCHDIETHALSKVYEAETEAAR